MKKTYEIDGNTFGIDFDSVLCFYLKNNGLYFKNLIIIVGGKIGPPTEVVVCYSCYYSIHGTWEVDGDGHKLYEDLIRYFNKTQSGHTICD